MPEPLILICGPALDANESAASLDLLRQVTLPNAVKFLVTTGKFDAEGAAKTVNVEADYPADPAYLQTLLRWAEIRELADPRFRDGFDLYCLRRILARFKKFDYAVLLRGGASNLKARWPKLQGSIEGRVFLTFHGAASAGGAASPGPSLLIDFQDKRSAAFLDAAWELYLSGAVYGMADYSLDGALGTALDTVELERALRQSRERERADLALPTDTHDGAEDRLVASQTE